MCFRYCLLLLLTAVITGCKNKLPPEETSKSITALPMNAVSLNDLSGFHQPSSNWKITGQVVSDYTIDQDLETVEGTGVLVNMLQDSGNENLHTIWDHGDLELALEFMVPKGSNSGVYFQGRYEIQLFDSWRVPLPTYSDCGGIYQRWDETAAKGEEGYEGRAPAVNSSRAPGLWQHLYVKFTAPRFDSNGEKLSNARFDKVILNGELIHQDVQLTGSTRAAMAENEVPAGPLMIQGDHGNVAFRNIKYKKYSDQKVGLAQMTYKYYETENSPILPDLDTLEIINQGKVDSFDVTALAKREDFFGIRYEAVLSIPTSGDYLFHTISDDASKLYIDQQLVVDNDLNLGVEKRSGLVRLDKGTHQLQVDYHNNVWGKKLQVFLEGPELSYHPFYSKYNEANTSSPDLLPLFVDSTEIVRGFVNYKNEKRTHAISVGDAAGIHFSFDLTNGTLLKCWRGNFADVSNMWRSRGNSQLVVPLSPSIDLSDGSIMAVLKDKMTPYPEEEAPGLKSLGYRLDEHGKPAFEFALNEAVVTDRVYPSTDGDTLERETIFQPNNVKGLHTRLARADYIVLLDNGLYSIGGQYYLNLLSKDVEPIIRDSNGAVELMVAIDGPLKIKYSLLW